MYMWKTRQENPPAGSSVTNKRTFLYQGVGQVVTPGRCGGSEETHQGSVDGAAMLSSSGKLSSLLGRSTNAHSRWRERQRGQKVASQQETLVHAAG